MSQAARDRRAAPRFGEIASDAIGYWERRRVLYNLALAGVVGAHGLVAWPASRSALTWDTFFLLIFLAVLANVCYCAAYAVDLFVQYSGLRSAWGRWRWVVLTIGIVFGAVIAHFFSMGIFSEPGAGPSAPMSMR
ncbi:MAG TPA: hypothetical protein VGV60_03305 [Candidatus Polarisedimenticolia bacterium]|jgi:hypothetical protein|nr:hypothetical protein [Candidatus Polarisedimenticolia bacterium]